MGDVHETVISLFREIVPEDAPISIQPPVFHELGLCFVGYDPGVKLVCEIPAAPRFANPTGGLQGGIMLAAFDAAFGSLAYLAAGAPCVTITLDSSFARPMRADGAACRIEVRLQSATRNFVFLDGAASNGSGEILASARTTMAVLRPRG